MVEDSRLLLANKDRRVRLWTLCALDGTAINMQGPTRAREEITALLVDLLGDPDGRVREVAASLLRRSETADALGPVARLLDDNSQPVGVRVQAAWACVELHEDAWPEWCQAHDVYSDEFGSDDGLISTVLRFRRSLGE
jgi:HEAT repeat protein